MPEAQQVSQAFPLEGWSLESTSREDIIRALDDAQKIYSKAYTQIARISSSVVVKYGSEVHLLGGEDDGICCENATCAIAKGL